MKGDFSRFTFDPDKQYIGTLMQQGRVQLDADWNEQQAIDRHQRQSLGAELIGPYGAPNQGGGFAVGLASGGADLSLSAGTLFVDGLRVENDQNHLLSAQPFLALAQGGLAGFQWPTQSGRYLVYLDVWERHITSLEDPHIRESALGGADTTTRIQLVWQAKLSDQPIGNAQCESFPPGWTPPGLTNGTLTARTAENVSQQPCLLPPTAGFKGLENQLYRVEIHRSGIRDNPNQRPTIKWSRDNASIATTVSVDGVNLKVHDLGRDDVLGFAPNQWVEIIDRSMELGQQHGVLLQIDTINTEQHIITVKNGTVPASLDTSAPVILRRWDNTGTVAGVDGVAMTNAPMSLEKGIQIQFSGGRYRSGDFWLIPARTAIDKVTGYLDWPRDGAGEPMAKSTDGVRHRYCPLAVVEFNSQAGTFSLYQRGDCRLRFPALTDIRAEDVSFDSSQCEAGGFLTQSDTVQQALDALCAQQRNGCSFLITRQEDLQAVFQQIASTSVTHARICFQTGDYRIDDPLLVGSDTQQKGHLVISGFGAGTRLIVNNAETFLRFQNCASVTLRDLSVQARHVGNASATEHLNGALSFIDCRRVTVEDCQIECASGALQGATGITASYSSTSARRDSSVRVRRCRIATGHEQVGILTFDAARTHIEDNEIVPATLSASMNLARMLVNKGYRAAARRALVSHLQYDGQAPADTTNLEIVRYGNNRPAYFRTAPSLIGQWQALLDSLGPRPSSSQGLRDLLTRAADQVLLNTVNATQFPAFAGWRRQLDRRFRVNPAQGVVVSGSSNGGEARILNNTITGALQGIRLGYSREERSRRTPVRALAAQIRGNRIRMIITPIVTRHPEGLFVGSYSDEMILEANAVSAAFSASSAEINVHVEGIKVYGDLGSLLVIRHNTVSSVDSAIRVVPLNGSHTGHHRWLVADNLASGFESGVTIPTNLDQIGNHPGGVSYRDLIAVFERVR